MRPFVLLVCLALACVPASAPDAVPTPVPLPQLFPTPVPGFTLHVSRDALNFAAETPLRVFYVLWPDASFSGDVTVSIENLPPGVSVTEVPTDEWKGAFDLSAAPGVSLPEFHVARVRAVAGSVSKTADLAMISRPTTGRLDPTFGEGGVVTLLRGVTDVDEQPDGKLLVTGSEWVGRYQSAICRLDVDGSIDSSFGEDGCTTPFPDMPWSLKRAIVTPDGIITAGTGGDGLVVARFTQSGILDATFGDDGWITFALPYPAAPNALLVGEESLLIAGYSPSSGFVSRLHLDGTLDHSFGDHGAVRFEFYEVRDIAELEDGRIIVVNGGGVHALLPDGKVDSTFGAGGTIGDGAQAVEVSRDTIFVAGYFSCAVARLSLAGEMLSYHDGNDLDGDWEDDGYLYPDTKDIGVATDGSIVFAATLSGEELAACRRTSRFHMDSGFAPNGFMTTSISGVAVGVTPLADGKSIVYGTSRTDDDTDPVVGYVLRIDG